MGSVTPTSYGGSARSRPRSSGVLVAPLSRQDRRERCCGKSADGPAAQHRGREGLGGYGARRGSGAGVHERLALAA